MRIDLHTHSLHSDGSDTPTELVAAALEARLDVIALTDHDTVAGWDEALAAGARLGVDIVLGVELSVTNQGLGQHLLGYDVDPNAAALGEILRRGATSREDRAEALFERLDQLGMPVDREAVAATAGGIPSRKHVAAGLVGRGYFEDEDQAFRELLNEGREGYVQRYRPSIEDAIAAIRAANGVSVIAHPRDARRGPGVSDARLAELKDVGLDGVEVDHQAHPSEVRSQLRDVAARLELAVTGSSDCHGDER